MAEIILAGDLSLSACGAVVVDSGWDVRPQRVKAWTLSVPLPASATEHDKTLRIKRLTSDFVKLALHYRPTQVWLEDLPTHAARGVIGLAEFRGALRVELERVCGLTVRFVANNSARKLLYGTVAPRGLTPAARKAWLLEPLLIAGLPLKGDAQGDAFCVANFALAACDAPHLSNLCGTPEHFAALSKEKAKDRARAKRKGVAA